jgi:phosphoribosyl-ATP pyrophosphohydrolase/phosphoribosyl-AMP cyclohydrolase/histidinol dehydrogenase
MTVATARAAGVPSVWVASPRPARATLAAAAIAGADGLVAVGGAQAIAALAFGVGDVPRCDLIAGPGNRWVTAAKRIVAGEVGVDMVAGPSELVVLADETADADTVAADLLAQAEHDPDAFPILVTNDRKLIEAVDEALAAKLVGLVTAATASASLQNGGAVLVPSLEVGVEVCNRLAPEHLEVMARDARSLCPRLTHFGALFVGGGAAEVFGDYGAGPNHVLPTGGAARFTGGLSVFNFLRVRTWIEITDLPSAQPLARDAIAFAGMEGLAAHAASAARRLVEG